MGALARAMGRSSSSSSGGSGGRGSGKTTYVEGVGEQYAPGTAGAVKQAAYEAAYKESTRGRSVSGRGQWRERAPTASEKGWAGPGAVPEGTGVISVEQQAAIEARSRTPAIVAEAQTRLPTLTQRQEQILRDINQQGGPALYSSSPELQAQYLSKTGGRDYTAREIEEAQKLGGIAAREGGYAREARESTLYTMSPVMGSLAGGAGGRASRSLPATVRDASGKVVSQEGDLSLFYSPETVVERNVFGQATGRISRPASTLTIEEVAPQQKYTEYDFLGIGIKVAYPEFGEKGFKPRSTAEVEVRVDLPFDMRFTARPGRLAAFEVGGVVAGAAVAPVAAAAGSGVAGSAVVGGAGALVAGSTTKTFISAAQTGSPVALTGEEFLGLGAGGAAFGALSAVRAHKMGSLISQRPTETRGEIRELYEDPAGMYLKGRVVTRARSPGGRITAEQPAGFEAVITDQMTITRLTPATGPRQYAISKFDPAATFQRIGEASPQGIVPGYGPKTINTYGGQTLGGRPQFTSGFTTLEKLPLIIPEQMFGAGRVSAAPVRSFDVVMGGGQTGGQRGTFSLVMRSDLFGLKGGGLVEVPAGASITAPQPMVSQQVLSAQLSKVAVLPKLNVAQFEVGVAAQGTSAAQFLGGFTRTVQKTKQREATISMVAPARESVIGVFPAQAVRQRPQAKVERVSSVLMPMERVGITVPPANILRQAAIPGVRTQTRTGSKQTTRAIERVAARFSIAEFTPVMQRTSIFTTMPPVRPPASLLQTPPTQPFVGFKPPDFGLAPRRERDGVGGRRGFKYQPQTAATFFGWEAKGKPSERALQIGIRPMFTGSTSKRGKKRTARPW